MRAAISLLIGLAFGFQAAGQDYYYVYDPDMYALVRERADVQSPVVDTVWMMQVLKTGEASGNWMKVKGRDGSQRGWIHSSRLRAMSEGSAALLDELNEWPYAPFDIFIAGADIPEVVVRIDYPGYDFTPSYHEPSRLSVRPGEDAVAFFIPTGELVGGWGVPVCLTNVDIFEGRLIFYDNFTQYTFMRDPEGHALRFIVPTVTFATNAYSRREMDDAAALSERLFKECEGKDAQTAWEIAAEVVGVNNFELLAVLRSMYFSGEQGGGDYPSVLSLMPCDAGGCHYMDHLHTEIWVWQNAGVKRLD